MRKVKLGEVATEVKENRKEDKTGCRIVGLEHLTPSCVTLNEWSENEENTFTKQFCKGDVLFGRRRAYLKKAAMAPFDGICSGDITVIRAIPDEIDSMLLPFVIQNDQFFDFAVGKSAGSLSPRVKWEHLKQFEFCLPDMEEQRKLADVLWAIHETKEAYRKLIECTDELVKAQFIEMFGDPVANPKGWEKKCFEEISSLITDGEHITPRRSESGIYLLSARNILNHEISFGEVDYIDNDEYERISKRLIPQCGDVLISCSGTVGRVCVVPENLKFQLVRSVALIRFNNDINPFFMEQQIAHSYIQDQIEASKSQTSQANLFQGKIKKLTAIIPPKELQQEFVDFAEQSDKSKLELTQSIESADNLMKAILFSDLESKEG